MWELTALILVGCAVAIYIAANRKTSRPRRSSSPASVSAKSGRQIIEKVRDDGVSTLVRTCMGDKEKAERLIQYEQKRMAGVSRKEAVTRAIERIERERK